MNVTTREAVHRVQKYQLDSVHHLIPLIDSVRRGKIERGNKFKRGGNSKKVKRGGN